MPELVEFWRNSKEKDLKVVVVSSGSITTNQEFVRQFEIPFPLLIQDEVSSASELYDVVDITPFVFAIDALGRIRFKGLVEGSQQFEQVAETLGQPYHEHSSERRSDFDLRAEATAND